METTNQKSVKKYEKSVAKLVFVVKFFYAVNFSTSDEGKVNMKQTTKDVIYAALFGLIGGSVLAITYILRTGGF